jgi:Flp pilus assembly protein TadG
MVICSRRRCVRTPHRASRAGVATVELAVCLPLICLLVFGSIQACNLIFLKHSITTAAYEGTLELVKAGSTNESVATRVAHVLDMRGVKKYKVNLSPGNKKVENTTAGFPFEIQVMAEVNPNLMLKGWFATTSEVSYTVTCPR